MQSGQIKIFMYDEYIFILFYKDGSIFIKKHNDKNEASKITENVLPQFSVCNDNGKPVVIVKKADGYVYICRYRYKKWEERRFFKAETFCNTKFYIHTNKERTDILYNCPSGKKGEEDINAVSFINKKWQMPVNIENVAPFSTTPYMVLNITSEHLLVLFNKNNEGIAMKEILLSPLRVGKTIPIFSPADAVADISSVIKNDTVHIAFIANGRRGSRLIYKNKSGSDFSENKVIWENGRIKSCIIFYVKSRLWIIATAGMYYFCSYSDDNGISFCPVYRHRTKISGPVAKAEFIGARDYPEVYVYPSANEIAFLDDICEDVFVKENGSKKEAEDSNEDMSNKVSILRNKMEIYEKQLNEANKRIGELSRKLAQRNEELSVINSRWIKRMNSLNRAEDKKQLPSVIAESPPHEGSLP